MTGIAAALLVIVAIIAGLRAFMKWEERQAINWDGLRLTNDDVIDAHGLPLSQSDVACRIRAEILASEAARYLRESA